MPNDLDQATAAAPKNVKITSVRIPLQTLLSQTRNARKHMTTEHTVVRSGKLKRKLGTPLANYRDLWLQLPPRIERHANHARGVQIQNVARLGGCLRPG